MDRVELVFIDDLLNNIKEDTAIRACLYHLLSHHRGIFCFYTSSVNTLKLNSVWTSVFQPVVGIFFSFRIARVVYECSSFSDRLGRKNISSVLHSFSGWERAAFACQFTILHTLALEDKVLTFSLQNVMICSRKCCVLIYLFIWKWACKLFHLSRRAF